MDDNEEESVKCIVSRMLVPGDVVMMRMRLSVLHFAAERKWVVTGGWGQHAFLRSLDPSQSVYDVRRACTMSDVDTLCIDPLADLIELAVRLYKDTGTEMIVGCGMRPNLFHLKVNWGGESLVDAIGVDAATFALIPTRTYPLSLLLGGGTNSRATSHGTKLTTLDPLYEYSIMHIIVDSAFEASNDDVQKRLDRMAPLEKALFPLTPDNSSTEHGTRTGSSKRRTPSSPLYGGIRAAGMASLVARVPGAPQPEIMVPAADAVAVLGVVLREAARSSNDATVAFYAPFVWGSNYSIAIEVSIASMVTLRVYCVPMPIPLQSGRTGTGGASGIAMMSTGTASTHLLLTALWRHSLGDADGARRRAEAAYALMASMVGKRKGTTRYYAGTIPATNVFHRYLRRRATNRGCMVKYTTTADTTRSVIDAVAQAKRSPGSQLARFDGRLLATHTCAALAATREALVDVLRVIVDENVMSEQMFPDWRKSLGRPQKNKNKNKNRRNKKRKNNRLATYTGEKSRIE